VESINPGGKERERFATHKTIFLGCFFVGWVSKKKNATQRAGSDVQGRDHRVIQHQEWTRKSLAPTIQGQGRLLSIVKRDQGTDIDEKAFGGGEDSQRRSKKASHESHAQGRGGWGRPEEGSTGCDIYAKKGGRGGESGSTEC